MHKFFSGITLIVMGTLALLQVIGLVDLGLTLIPCFLVWIGLEMVWGSLFNHWHAPSIFGAALGLFVAGLGLVRILANNGLFIAHSAGDWLRLGWPVLIVALGLSLLFRPRGWRWD